MRKLILKCHFSVGDIVMMTAAVRDLHYWYPKQFLTDVRTAFPDLWENNPYITPLSDDDPAAEQIECSYPLINRCNEAPYHCLHGFIEFLNDRLGLAVRPTVFKGDIHLSSQEKAWYSQVHELTGEDTPFWIMAAGGKYDVTIKWWETKRFQEVTDYFRGKILFVQVGQEGHHHPKINRVVDLRGKTNLRELIRLVYHARGVICPVTALMHLAAAVESKNQRSRPCVVIAGGREPAHWEAYPDHQFIHTNGMLRCAVNGGCWKDRVIPLRDGDKRDRRDHLCVDVVNGLPRCMDMIPAGEVIRRIEMHFRGGVAKYLSKHQQEEAVKGISASDGNLYDQQPLNIHSAGMACDEFIKTLPTYPGHYEGRGIVICGGGVRYFTNAWVCINMLRRQGCRLPIQIWYLGKKEMDGTMKALLAPLGVECIDACKMRKKIPVRILRGWPLKPYAIVHSPFREVLFLDADNVPVTNPEFLFDTPQFKTTGAIFWPDYNRGPDEKARAVWRSCGLCLPDEPEFETGQIVVDKERCWPALSLALWFNANSDFYYQHVYGDKETFHLAFRKLKKNYSLVPEPIHRLDGTMCQHDFDGRRIFQHRNTDKWDMFLRNRHVADFWFEDECRDYIAQLRRKWDGKIATGIRTTTHGRRRLQTKPLRIQAVMAWGSEDRDRFKKTLANLADTDWADEPLQVQIDEDAAKSDRSSSTFIMLEKSLKWRADYFLFLEGNLEFNQYIHHNLQSWTPVRTQAATVASLFNPGVREIAFDLKNNARVVEPECVSGGPAFIISRSALELILHRWNKLDSISNIKLVQLFSRLRDPVFYHAPSLVRSEESGKTGFRQAIDFDPSWTA